MNADSIARELRGSFYRKNRLAFAAAALASLLNAVLSLILSWLMQQLIDAAAGAPGALPFGVLVRACGGFFLLIFCGAALLFGAKPRFLAAAMEQYRNCAVSYLMQKSVPDFQRQPSAAYLSALTNDAATIENDYLTQQFALLTKLCCFAGALAMMLAYSAPLTLAALVLALLPFAASLAAGNRLANATRLVSDCNRDFTAFLSDCLNGFPVIRSFRAEIEINKRFAAENHRLEQQKRTRLQLQTLLESAGSFTGVAAQLGVFLLGTWLALSGRGVTPGIVIMFVNLMNFLVEPLAELPSLLAARKAALALVQKLADALAGQTAQPGGQTLPQLNEQIELRQVSYSYTPGKPVLNDLSVRLEAGRAYAVVGASGGGKSTLLRLLHSPESGADGQILFDGIDIRALASESLNDLVSVVQQNVFVFNASIRDNITMFRAFPDKTINEVICRAHLEELVARRGLDALCGEGGSKLSGGEKQRIAIARALLKHSSILLADEATAALDAQTAHEISQDILSLTGITRVVVTHRLEASLLQEYDGILVLKEGRLAETGTFEELVRRGGYFNALYTLAH